MAPTLSDLVNALFEKHSPAAALDNLHQQISQVLSNQQIILANQETAQIDLNAIKVFLGVRESFPGEVQRVIDEQTAALKQLNIDLQSILPKEN